jgi:hypothetical protein
MLTAMKLTNLKEIFKTYKVYFNMSLLDHITRLKCGPSYILKYNNVCNVYYYAEKKCSFYTSYTIEGFDILKEIFMFMNIDKGYLLMRFEVDDLKNKLVFLEKLNRDIVFLEKSNKGM